MKSAAKALDRTGQLGHELDLVGGIQIEKEFDGVLLGQVRKGIASLVERHRRPCIGERQRFGYYGFVD